MLSKFIRGIIYFISGSSTVDSYAPLLEYLSKQSGDVTLTYSELKKILGEELPPSASKYRSWWANNDSHTQALHWAAASYRVSKVDLGKSVTFSKI